MVGEIPKALQVAMAFAREPLCETAVGFHSATPWYEANAFSDVLYGDSNPEDLPEEASSFPCFCGNELVYHRIVESTPFGAKGPGRA